MSPWLPAFQRLIDFLTRHIIERNSNELELRKDLARELRENCEEWAAQLLATFDDATRMWRANGRDAALNAIHELIQDFIRLDYDSLGQRSPILLYLEHDGRFRTFVFSCRCFYKEACNIKHLVFRGIQNRQGRHITLEDTDIQEVVNAHRERMELMLRRVRNSHNEIRTFCSM